MMKGKSSLMKLGGKPCAVSNSLHAAGPEHKKPVIATGFLLLTHHALATE